MFQYENYGTSNQLYQINLNKCGKKYGKVIQIEKNSEQIKNINIVINKVREVKI